MCNNRTLYSFLLSDDFYFLNQNFRKKSFSKNQAVWIQTRHMYRTGFKIFAKKNISRLLLLSLAGKELKMSEDGVFNSGF